MYVCAMYIHVVVVVVVVVSGCEIIKNSKIQPCKNLTEQTSQFVNTFGLFSEGRGGGVLG